MMDASTAVTYILVHSFLRDRNEDQAAKALNAVLVEAIKSNGGDELKGVKLIDVIAKGLATPNSIRKKKREKSASPSSSDSSDADSESEDTKKPASPVPKSKLKKKVDAYAKIEDLKPKVEKSESPERISSKTLSSEESESDSSSSEHDESIKEEEEEGEKTPVKVLKKAFTDGDEMDVDEKPSKTKKAKVLKEDMKPTKGRKKNGEKKDVKTEPSPSVASGSESPSSESEVEHKPALADLRPFISSSSESPSCSSDSDSGSSSSSSSSSSSGKIKPKVEKAKSSSSSSTSSSSSSPSSSSSSSSSESDSDSEAETSKKEPLPKTKPDPDAALVTKKMRTSENGNAVPTATTSTGLPSRNSKRPERKQNVPFKRIDVTKFADNVVQENRYDAKEGPGNDYGLRAHQDLIVTRGAGFRKEKNKKKKGSYRGGEITMESHSFKFE